jgi:carbonic anhydrase
MKKNIIITSLLAAIIVITTVLITIKDKITKSKSDHMIWSYQGETGPEHWSKLSKKFAICESGKSQSPINIKTNDLIAVESNRLAIDYKPTTLAIVNNGHTIKIYYQSDSYISVGQETYKLKEFHFHTPSEHTINDVNFPMVIHLEHETKDGKITVTAVFVVEGETNSTIAKIIENMPMQAGQKVVKNDVLINASDLLPKQGSFYQLRGSLTKPPCTENVLWNILETPITLSKEQIETFKSVMGHNARPAQDLNDRNVLDIKTK